MSQTSLWQAQPISAEYAELCNALYERELRILANGDFASVQAIQGKVKSLSYYINRTAHLMTQQVSPLQLDVQNASWSAKQTKKMPLAGQNPSDVWLWYTSFSIPHGLIVPILHANSIVLDSIDRIDADQQRFRTNKHGWFTEARMIENTDNFRLLKPNKKVMTAACAGHCWHSTGTARPIMPSLRELLLSCAINWRNFKQPIVF
ncbi:hypothetical protein [Thalassotalea agariperforans]